MNQQRQEMNAKKKEAMMFEQLQKTRERKHAVEQTSKKKEEEEHKVQVQEQDTKTQKEVSEKDEQSRLKTKREAERVEKELAATKYQVQVEEAKHKHIKAERHRKEVIVKRDTEKEREVLAKAEEEKTTKEDIKKEAIVKAQAIEARKMKKKNGPPTVNLRIHNDTSWLPPENCECSNTTYCDMKALLKRNGAVDPDDGVTAKLPHAGANSE